MRPELPCGFFGAVARRVSAAAVLALCLALCTALAQAQTPASSPAKKSTANQNAEATTGGIAVNARDSATVIIERDPEVGILLKMLEEQQKERAAAEQFYREQLRVAQQKNEELARELRNQQAQAIEQVVQQARAPNASPAAVAAKRGLEAGNTKPAEALLREDERAAAAQGRESLRRAAALAQQQGALALLHDDTNAALGAYRRATEYEPDNPDSWWVLGDLFVRAGNLTEAERAYRRMFALSAERAAKDPSNSEWQRDLSVSHNKIGDILAAQGALAGALAAYRQGLSIAEKLAAQDPANSEWQRDLSVSHERIGDILRAQGDLAGALAAYRKSLDIRRRLAAQDPSNAVWQTDVVVSCWKLGSLAGSGVENSEAVHLLERGVEILKQLDAQGRLSAGQQGWLQQFTDELHRVMSAGN
jgi:tetratricopeptide (TPR) repeat protein